MRLMDVLIQQVERYGVMRASDAAKAAFDAAIAEVTAPDYVPIGIAALYPPYRPMADIAGGKEPAGGGVACRPEDLGVSYEAVP